MRGEFMKVVVSAGGTGGHIYPALAILEKLKKEVGNLEVLYIGCLLYTSPSPRD